VESAARVQDWAFGRPAPPLTPFVAGYHGYRLAGLPPARHAGLPSPFLTLILSLDEPLVVATHPDPTQPGGSYRTLVGGLHTRPALITHQGAQSGVQISLDPLGARALLGVPAGELAELDVDADAVLGGLAERAREQMLAASFWQARFAVLDRLLLARLRATDAAPPPPEVVHAWRRLRTSGGAVRVDALALETGWSARHLGAVLRREIGLPPKAAARVVRFDRARRLIAGTGGRVADVAAAVGYADQSHLDRDFREFAGAPPSRWLAEEVRNVQVPPPEQLAVSMP
jgi:AraC-like DNA-binding protein